MEYVIGIILVIIVLLIIGLILRKRVYDQVDRLEAWKLEIMGRNVAGELSRIKSLNLSGETQDKFEAWKDRWDHILGKELADIEDHLLDAENAADRFQISKGKRIIKEADDNLQSIEINIENILMELNELLESEKTSRIEAETIEPTIKDLRRTISQNRYQFGKADAHYEKILKQLENDLVQYHEQVESGNYMEAKELVIQMKQKLNEIAEQIESFPEVYKTAKHDLPYQLDNLLSGLKEMRSDGYFLDHLSFDKEIRTYQEELTRVVQMLENGELIEGREVLNETEARISEMYELLENEAVAKNYLERQLPSYEDAVATLDTSFERTKEEVEEMKKAYYVDEKELDNFLTIGKRIEKLKEELYTVLDRVETNSAAHSELRSQVEVGLEQIRELEEKHKYFQETIHTLRKDELDAREKLNSMREQITHLHRRLRLSNIPGVPTYIWNSLEATQEKNMKVIQALEKHPLDTGAVHDALLEAEHVIEETREKIDMMLDQAYLTGQVIQYANRYRSRYPILAAELHEAERLFRVYEYELSLEKAAKAIEEIEPGALKRIEENQLRKYN